MNIGGLPSISLEGTGAEDFNLTCTVTVVEYLTVESTVQWSDCEGSVDNKNGKHYSQWSHEYEDTDIHSSLYITSRGLYLPDYHQYNTY